MANGNTDTIRMYVGGRVKMENVFRYVYLTGSAKNLQIKLHISSILHMFDCIPNIRGDGERGKKPLVNCLVKHFTIGIRI